MHDRTYPELEGHRVLVIGGSGFIGSHLVEHLLELDATVGVLSRRLGGPLASKAASLQFLKADLKDEKAVHNAFREFPPEVVFHLASHPDGEESFKHCKTSIEDNLLGTLNLLEAHRRSGKGLLVMGGSTKIYGNVEPPYREATREQPNSSYAISKAAAWHLCLLYSRLHGFPTVCIRPTLIYGPGQGFNIISYIVKCVDEQQEKIVLAGGDQTRDPLYIDDAVEAYLASAQRRLNGRVINIGGGSELTVTTLADHVTALAGGKADMVSAPENARPTEIWRSWCDGHEARELINWQSHTHLDEGLRRTIAWIRSKNARTMEL